MAVFCCFWFGGDVMAVSKVEKIGVLKVGRVVPCKVEKMKLCGSLLTSGYRLATNDQRLTTSD